VDIFAVLGARLLRSRRFTRAPIWLFRRGLGWIFGGRVLLLEHVGRRSGQSRYVCLESVERRPGAVVVVSGFGERAQWYQNLRARPDCYVTVGRSRVRAHARFMPADEASATFERYALAHPRAWGQLRAVIERAVGRPIAGLPMVELTFGDGPETARVLPGPC
jgi:deazaflavin-dependent oxidoreductase (nitroreductase family)